MSQPDFTHHLDLWIAGSDAALYEACREIAREASRYPWTPTGLDPDSFDISDRIRWRCQELMKEAVEGWVYDVLDTLPDGSFNTPAGIVREFVTMGLAAVDWDEMARDYLESIEDEEIEAIA